MSAKLQEKGAARIYCACTHPVFSDKSVERIEESAISECVVTDSIPLDEKIKNSTKIKQLSIGALLARAITRIHNEESLSVLFNTEDEV